MATMNVSLPDPMKSWVERQAADGQYSNASDYVRHLIRRDQERGEALAQLQNAITEGLGSGEPVSVDPERLKASMRPQKGR
jgi:antitoxin ParD1/3/4